MSVNQTEYFRDYFGASIVDVLPRDRMYVGDVELYGVRLPMFDVGTITISPYRLRKMADEDMCKVDGML